MRYTSVELNPARLNSSDRLSPLRTGNASQSGAAAVAAATAIASCPGTSGAGATCPGSACRGAPCSALVCSALLCSVLPCSVRLGLEMPGSARAGSAIASPSIHCAASLSLRGAGDSAGALPTDNSAGARLAFTSPEGVTSAATATSADNPATTIRCWAASARVRIRAIPSADNLATTIRCWCEIRWRSRRGVAPRGGLVWKIMLWPRFARPVRLRIES